MITTGAFGPVMAPGGVAGAKITVPEPVPLLPALSPRPSGRPRLCAGMPLPRVRVIFAAMFTLLAAHSKMLPSVVVSAATAATFTSRPAPSSTLPLTVVTAALRLTSRPQHATRLPLVAVIAELMLTSRTAFRVSVVGLVLAVQLTAWLTKMSPGPTVPVCRLLSGGVPATTVLGPGVVLIVTLLVTSSADSVAPVMLSLTPPPIVKSSGSISQLPVCPCGASVVTMAPLPIFTCAAEVSMKPPLPPPGALASSVPPRAMLPDCMSPISLITPPWFSSRWARITPVLLTAVCSRCPAAWVVSSTWPPSAWIRPPFWTSACRAPWSTPTLSSLSPDSCNVIALPAAIATMPKLAAMRPSLLTLAPSSAT